MVLIQQLIIISLKELIIFLESNEFAQGHFLFFCLLCPSCLPPPHQFIILSSPKAYFFRLVLSLTHLRSIARWHSWYVWTEKRLWLGLCVIKIYPCWAAHSGIVVTVTSVWLALRLDRHSFSRDVTVVYSIVYLAWNMVEYNRLLAWCKGLLSHFAHVVQGFYLSWLLRKIDAGWRRILHCCGLWNHLLNRYSRNRYWGTNSCYSDYFTLPIWSYPVICLSIPHINLLGKRFLLLSRGFSFVPTAITTLPATFKNRLRQMQ